MDSLTQLTLGAAIGVATMGRRTAAWKAALWGGVAGTLPDLDVLIDHGDPILNMVLHRAETHAPLWLTLFSLPFAAAVARLHGEWGLWRRWWLALWLALVTHPLLDTLTVYGTQLALPFTDRPFGVGSVFIIDPLVTLPWLVGVVWAVAAGFGGRAGTAGSTRGATRGLRANRIGLALGCLYLAWGLVAQNLIEREARRDLAAQGLPAERVLVTPAPFNTLLWRIVAVDGESVHEGFRSFFDGPGPIRFLRYDQGAALRTLTQGHEGAGRVRAFSQGFYAYSAEAGRVRISDLRMGQYPGFVFSFELGACKASDCRAGFEPLAAATSVGGRSDFGPAMRWLWQRMWGRAIDPPGWPQGSG
jgi:inner membrane protein